MHPKEKLLVRDGKEWCMDVFDKFVGAGDSVCLGEAVTRRYQPVVNDNNHIVLYIFSSNQENPDFITDPNVELCGSLSLNLDPLYYAFKARKLKDGHNLREIQAKMLFGDTEIKASAMDVGSKQTVRAYVDFLNESNPKYTTKM
jgi:hypothetical protein